MTHSLTHIVELPVALNNAQLIFHDILVHDMQQHFIFLFTLVGAFHVLSFGAEGGSETPFRKTLEFLLDGDTKTIEISLEKNAYPHDRLVAARQFCQNVSDKEKCEWLLSERLENMHLALYLDLAKMLDLHIDSSGFDLLHVEGNSQKYWTALRKKIKIMHDVALLTNRSGTPPRICETGFNAGHSALIWLLSHPGSTVVSFDLGKNVYVRAAYGWFKEYFPGRVDLQLGDSKQTLPAYRRKYPEAPPCDLWFVDGGHDFETASSDLQHAIAMSSEKTVIIMDDVDFGMVSKAWQNAIASKSIAELGRVRSIFQPCIEIEDTYFSAITPCALCQEPGAAEKYGENCPGASVTDVTVAYGQVLSGEKTVLL